MAKISDVKVGDKVRILAVRKRVGALQEFDHRRVGKLAIVEAIPGREFPMRVRVLESEPNETTGLQEGDFELVQDFEDDEHVKAYRSSIAHHKDMIEQSEKMLAGRIANLTEAAKPKQTLPAIEKQWLQHWNAPQYGIDDACKYGSLEEAYEALKLKRREKDCTAYGVWCHNQVGTMYASGNPFNSPAFRQQIEMLKKLAPVEVRK
jgi:hypothetical protein